MVVIIVSDLIRALLHLIDWQATGRDVVAEPQAMISVAKFSSGSVVNVYQWVRSRDIKGCRKGSVAADPDGCRVRAASGGKSVAMG